MNTKVSKTKVSSMQRNQSQAVKIHWLYWGVVVALFLITIAGWEYAKRQLDEKVSQQFHREAQQSIDHIIERMRKYEDALWSGVAFCDAVGRDITYDEWVTYSESIRIDEKYPGINGIGVIYAFDRAEAEEFLEQQRVLRPDFKIHPSHSEDVLYPITYIEPVETNRKAVGLDMAHESNRFIAAKKARDTGSAQVTGPIVLVQDANQTPGFLFYAPFYKDAAHSTQEERVENFVGLVYAPFVASELVKGVLDRENRNVDIRLKDGADVLFDEHVVTEADYDADPLFTMSKRVFLYGREWTFDVWSAKSFRKAQNNSQPLMILLSGIGVDVLLVLLFMTNLMKMTKAYRVALDVADSATSELEERNKELEQFVYTASHDLKSPLLTIQGFTGFLKQDLEDGRTDRVDQFLGNIIEGTNRMRSNVDDLLELSRVGRVVGERQPVDVASFVSIIVHEMSSQLDDDHVHITVNDDIPTINCDIVTFRNAIINLISNALKYAQQEDKMLRITIGGETRDGEVCVFVADNGPGVPDKYKEKIFGLFERLKTVTEGTGIGLAIVSRIAINHGGRAWVEDTPGGGATFYMSFSK